MERISVRLLPRAMEAFRAGDYAQAERLVRRVLRAEPMNAKANEQLAYFVGNRGDIEQARQLLEKATLSPEASRESWYLLGRLLLQQGEPAGAASAFRRAVGMDAGFFEALHDLGLSLTEVGETDEAVAQFDRAIALQPRSLEALYNRARALYRARRYEDAARSYDRALEVDPRHVDSWTSRGAALLDLDRSEEAADSFGQALAVAPRHVPALSGRGVALYDLQRDDEALASFARALESRPGDPDVEWRASFAHLARGDFERGWALQERRWDRTGAPPRPHAQVQPWRGEDLHAKRILAWSEQGYGDTLQFCRYVEILARDASRVILQVPSALRTLLSRSFSGCTVISWDEDPGACDFQIPLMSLPHACGTRLETVPSRVPYLSVDADRVERWRARLGEPGSRPRIGIACSGSPELRRDRTRSISLESFRVLGDFARLILIQRDIRAGDAVWLQENPGRVTAFDAIGDFDDSAAIVESMDLVVTVDTALAHLAGALGKPTWILLGPDSDWRWLRGRADSPWYPSARLFRQARGEPWDAVLERVRAAVGDLLR